MKNPRIWFVVGGAIILPAIFLYLEGIFPPGSLAWIIIALIVFLLGGFYSMWRYRKPPTPVPRSPGSDFAPTETIASDLAPIETVGTKLKDDREWCPLPPGELRAYVDREGLTSAAKKRRGKLYAGKWLHIRGNVKDVHSFVSNCDVDVRDPENPYGWSISASMADDQIQTARTLVVGDDVSISGEIDRIGSTTFLSNALFDQQGPQPNTHRYLEPLDETDAPGWFIVAVAATLRDIDQEHGNTQFSENLLNNLEIHLSQLGEDIDYLRPTKPRGMELRHLIDYLKRWHRVPPKTS